VTIEVTGLPYVWVQLDASWHIPGDPHPDARLAHAIADAIASHLLSAGVSPGNNPIKKARLELRLPS